MVLTVCTHYWPGEIERLHAILPVARRQSVQTWPDHQEHLYRVTREEMATLRLTLHAHGLGRWWCTP
jgi:hypothetical protein